jgi:hypothetical protein
VSPSWEVDVLSVQGFVICIAIGSALVALWFNVRFPNLMPWSMRVLLVHLVIALLVVYAVGPAMAVVGGSGIPAARLVSVFGVAFPVLVYEFLVGAWLIRLAQATGAGFRV